MIVTNSDNISDKKVAKVANVFVCELCDYRCSRLYNFNKHLTTEKHRSRHNSDKIVTKSSKKVAKSSQTIFTCECGKTYRYRQGLSFHKKSCQIIESNIDKSNDIYLHDNQSEINVLDCKSIEQYNIDDQSIISQLKDIIIKQQIQLDTQQQLCKQQQDQIGELIPRVGDQNTINNTQNTNYSINVFLNEKCKDAINMTDFVNSIKVSLDQLEYTTSHGLADGLTKTIMDNMNRLSIYERPLHCTDIKRETLYIKDDNKWSKDNSRERMKLAIKGATNANYRALKDWQGVHPDFRKDDRLTEYFTDMIVKLGRCLDGIDDKVLRNICRSTYLNLRKLDFE